MRYVHDFQFAEKKNVTIKVRLELMRRSSGRRVLAILFFHLPHNYVISDVEMKVHLYCGSFCPRAPAQTFVYCPRQMYEQFLQF